MPPPPPEEPTDDDEGTSSSDEAASQASVHDPEPSVGQPKHTGSHSDLKASSSLPDDKLVRDRTSQSPLQERRRSKSDTMVIKGLEKFEGQQTLSLSADDPFVQAVQREISEAFDVSDVDLNLIAEDLLTELAYDDRDGHLRERLSSSASVFTPSLWQETYQNLPEDYTVTNV